MMPFKSKILSPLSHGVFLTASETDSCRLFYALQRRLIFIQVDTLQMPAEVISRKQLYEPDVLQRFLCVDNVNFEACISVKHSE